MAVDNPQAAFTNEVNQSTELESDLLPAAAFAACAVFSLSVAAAAVATLGKQYF